jgi:preprotein translocase subunit SecG
MVYYLLVAVYVLVCLLLLVTILLQQGRAGDIASAFGGSSSQTVFGARTGATMLTRVTTVLATLFMIGSIGLAIAWQKAPSSVVSGVKTPTAPTAPATPPAAPAK